MFNKLKQFLFYIIIVILLHCVIALLVIFLYSQNNKQLETADAIVVLGAAAWGDKPSPVYKERLAHAINLYKNHTAKYIIFTGGTPKQGFATEAEVGKNWAIKNSIPSNVILKENKSRNTFENLENVKKIAKEHYLKSFIIVSDPYHLGRAKLIALFLNMNVQTSPTPTSLFNHLDSKKQFQQILKEMLSIIGFAYYPLIKKLGLLKNIKYLKLFKNN